MMKQYDKPLITDDAAAFMTNHRSADDKTALTTISRFRTPFTHLGVVRLHIGTINIFNVDHNPLTIFDRQSADLSTHSGLVIKLAISDGPKRCHVLEPLEGLDQGFCIGRTRLAD